MTLFCINLILNGLCCDENPTLAWQISFPSRATPGCISDVATFHTDRLLDNGECHIRTTKGGQKVYTWIPEWLQERIHERARRFGPGYSVPATIPTPRF